MVKDWKDDYVKAIAKAMPLVTKEELGDAFTEAVTIKNVSKDFLKFRTDEILKAAGGLPLDPETGDKDGLGPNFITWFRSQE